MLQNTAKAEGANPAPGNTFKLNQSWNAASHKDVYCGVTVVA